MTLLLWIVAFSLVGGTLSVLVAGVFLALSERQRSRLLPHLVSVATGSLLSAAFIGLLPEALAANRHADPAAITMTVLFGLFGFFILEKLVIWRHCHHDHCASHGPGDTPHKPAAGTLILVGDSIHNFVDGVLIAAAFLTDIRLGIITSLAAATHEIPQELGDFAILLDSGFSRRKAFIYNLLSSFATLVGALLAWLSLSSMNDLLPYILAIAASSFIYVAVADLIPGLHERTELRESLQQFLLISLGIAIVAVLEQVLH